MKRKNKHKSNLLIRTLRFQPGMAAGVLGLFFVIGGQMLGASASTTTTPLVCKPVAVRDINAAQPTASQVAYMVVSAGQGGITTAAVKAGSSCVGPLISLVTYKTTAANGMPRNQQVLYDSQTKALSLSVVNLSVRVPDCYYQTDLAYGLPLDLRTGVDYTGSTNYIWGVNGGTRVCADMTGAATPAPSVTPSRTPTATPTVTTSATPRPTVVVQPLDTPSSPQDQTGGGQATPTTTPAPNTTTQGGGSPTPSIIPLAPDESVPVTPANTSLFNALPQAGQAGSFMTFLGALFVTAGLLHVYLSQRYKVLKTPKR